MSKKKYYKWIGKDCKNFGFKFNLGLNIDINPFIATMRCGGGIYYTSKENIWNFFNNSSYYLAELTIPTQTLIVADGPDKFKSPRIFIDKINDLQTVEGWIRIKSIFGDTLKNRTPFDFMNDVSSFHEHESIEVKKAFIQTHKNKIYEGFYFNCWLDEIPLSKDIQIPFVEICKDLINTKDVIESVLKSCSIENKPEIRKILTGEYDMSNGTNKTNKTTKTSTNKVEMPTYDLTGLQSKTKTEFINLLIGVDLNKMIGKLGVFWDDDDDINAANIIENGSIGILVDIDDNDGYHYSNSHVDTYFNHFRPLTLEELSKYISVG